MKLFFEKLFLSLLSGYLFALPTILYDRVPLSAFIALVGWISISVHPRYKNGLYSSFLATYLGFYLFWVIANRFMSGFGVFVPYLLGITGAMGYMIFFLMLRFVKDMKPFPLFLSIPVIWCVTEWFVERYNFPDLTVYLSGYYLITFRNLVQVADISGIYGLNFLVGMINAFVIIFILKKQELHGWNPLKILYHVKWETGLLLVILFSCFIYGKFRLATLDVEPSIRVSIIQPNSKHDIKRPEVNFLHHVMMTEEEIKPGESDLIVWPENAVMEYFLIDGKYIVDIDFLAKRKNANILLGAFGNSIHRSTNAAYMVSNKGGLVNSYNKIHLVLYTEYLPFEQFLRKLNPLIWAKYRQFVRKIIGFVAEANSGFEPEIFTVQGKNIKAKFAPLICGESMKMEIVRKAVRRGARFLVNITSESLVGRESQQQMLYVSAMRAIENRVSFVRAGNNGISCFIKPDGLAQSYVTGKITGGLINEEGVLTDNVNICSNNPSFYTKHGPWFAHLCILVFCIIIISFWIRKYRKRLLIAQIKNYGEKMILIFLLVAFFLLAMKYLPQKYQSLTGTKNISKTQIDDIVLGSIQKVNPNTSIRYLEPFLKKQPEFSKAYSPLADSYMRAGRYEEGYLMFEFLQRKNPGSLELLFQLSNFQKRISRPESALNSLRTYFETRQCDTEMLKSYAQALYNGGYYLECIQLEELNCQESLDPYVQTKIAQSYSAIGNYEQALHLFEQILRKNPINLDANLFLARLYSKRGNYAEAIKICVKIIKVYPENETLLYETIRAKYMNGDYQNLYIIRNIIK